MTSLLFYQSMLLRERQARVIIDNVDNERCDERDRTVEIIQGLSLIYYVVSIESD